MAPPCRPGACCFNTLAGKQVVRQTFLLDPQGVIRHHWPEVIPQGHAERVLAVARRLMAGD